MKPRPKLSFSLEDRAGATALRGGARWQELVQRRRVGSMSSCGARCARCRCGHLRRESARRRRRCVEPRERRPNRSEICGRRRCQSSIRTFSARRAPDAGRHSHRRSRAPAWWCAGRPAPPQPPGPPPTQPADAAGGKLAPAAAPPAARPRTPPPPTPPPAITEALCPQCGLCTGEPRPAAAAPMGRRSRRGAQRARRRVRRPPRRRRRRRPRRRRASAARRRHGARPLDAQLDRRDDHPPEPRGGNTPRAAGRRRRPRASPRCS